MKQKLSIEKNQFIRFSYRKNLKSVVTTIFIYPKPVKINFCLNLYDSSIELPELLIGVVGADVF